MKFYKSLARKKATAIFSR